MSRQRQMTGATGTPLPGVQASRCYADRFEERFPLGLPSVEAYATIAVYGLEENGVLGSPFWQFLEILCVVTGSLNMRQTCLPSREGEKEGSTPHQRGVRRYLLPCRKSLL